MIKPVKCSYERPWLDLMYPEVAIEVSADANAGCIHDIGAIDGNDGGTLIITNEWSELRFWSLSLPEQHEAQNLYCVRNHTGMSDCCPDCGTDPEQRRATAFHNGEETEGLLHRLPQGVPNDGTIP